MGTDKERDTEKGREKNKESEERGKRGREARLDAVLKECRQALALHANQISKLRELFVHWPLVTPKRGASLTPTHIHIQKGTDTQVPINASQPLFSSLLSSSVHSLMFLFLSRLLLGCSFAVFALSRLHPSVLCTLSFCLSLYTATAEN